MTCNAVFAKSVTGFLGLVLCVTLLAACGTGNSVRLIYTPASSAMLPQPNAPRVTVVMFEDHRTQQVIGERRDGSAITPSSLVSDWVSRSLGDELSRLGMQVSYSTSLPQAKAAHPEYLITGSVRELWLKEVSATAMTATLRVEFTLSGKKGRTYSEVLTATQEKQGILTASATESLLADTLRDVVVPAAKKIQANLN